MRTITEDDGNDIAAMSNDMFHFGEVRQQRQQQ